MLVSKNAKIYVTPNPKPEGKSMEYRLPWIPNANFTRWPCTFNFFGVDFIWVGPRFSVEYELNLTWRCPILPDHQNNNYMFLYLNYTVDQT